METSLKTGFAQNFLLLPKKSELPKLWGGCSPPRPPGPYAYDMWFVHAGPFFFVKMSEESVIDCGDGLQGGIIVRKTKEFSVHSWTSWRLECTPSVSIIIEKKERLF